MRIPPLRAACALALLLALGACGDGRGPDGLTQEERDRLNQHAADLDSIEIIDASPDSLTVNDLPPAEQEAVPANGAANAQASVAAANRQ